MTYAIHAFVGGEWYDLPDWASDTTVGFDMMFSGMIDGKYLRTGVNANKLVKDVILALFCDGYEGDDSLFWIQAGAGSETDDDSKYFRVVAKSLKDVFRRTIVRNSAKPWKPVKYDDEKVGYIFNKLFISAQNRGAMQNLTWDFTPTHDSAGVAWADKIDIEFPPGSPLADTMTSLMDSGYFEMRIRGSVIQMFNFGGMGQDKSSSVEIAGGKDLIETPYKWSIEDRVGYSLMIGDGSAYVENTRAATPHGPFGIEEQGASFGGTKKKTTLEKINKAYLEKAGGIRQEYTRKVQLQTGGKRPVADYAIGDRIFDRTGPDTQNLRIRSMVLSPFEGSGTCTIALNDRFLENEIRLAKKISGISSASGGTSNGLPAVFVPDDTVPMPPTNIRITSGPYVNSQSVIPSVNSAMYVEWDAPTTNTDESAIDDIGSYEIRYKKLTETTYRSASTSFTYVDIRPLMPRDNYEVQIRTWDLYGNYSDWTTPVQSGPLKGDEDPPPRPSRPVVTSAASVVSVVVDTKDDAGYPMPVDVVRYIIYADVVSPPTQAVGGMAHTGGIYAFGASPGSTVYVQVFAQDYSGNVSAGSDVVSVHVNSILDDSGLAEMLGSKNSFYNQDADPKTTSTPIDGDWWTTLTPPVKLYYMVDGDWVEKEFDGGFLIKDGTIVAGLMAAGSIVAGNLAADSVVSDNIAADQILAYHIKAGTITADMIESGYLRAQVTVSGIIQTVTPGGTAGVGKRVVINSEGVTLFDENDNPVTFINTDGESFFLGTVNATGLTVSGIMSLTKAGNLMQPGSTLVLSAGVQAPTSGPSATSYWNGVQLRDGNGVAIKPIAVCEYKGCGNLTGTPNYANAVWISLCEETPGYPNVVRLHNAAGASLARYYIPNPGSDSWSGGNWGKVMTNSMAHIWSGGFLDPSNSIPEFALCFSTKYGIDGKSLGTNELGVAKLPFNPTTATGPTPGGVWTVEQYDGEWTIGSNKVSIAPTNNVSGMTSDMLVVGYKSTATNREIFRVVRARDGQLISTTANGTISSSSGHCVAVACGIFEFGTLHFVFATQASGFFRITDSAGVNKPLNEFAQVNSGTIAIVHDGTDFLSVDSNGVIWRHDGVVWGDANAFKSFDFGHTLYNLAPYESRISPIIHATLKKRARVRMSIPGWHPDGDVTHARYYVGATGGVMHVQTSNTVGYTVFQDLNLASAAPPGSSTFPDVTPAEIRNSSGTLVISALGTINGFDLRIGAKTNFTTNPAGSGWYRQFGPFVEVYFLTTSNVAAGANVDVFTLPAGWRPLTRISLAASGGIQGYQSVSGQIGTDGIITVKNTYTASMTVQGHAVFLIA